MTVNQDDRSSEDRTLRLGDSIASAVRESGRALPDYLREAVSSLDSQVSSGDDVLVRVFDGNTVFSTRERGEIYRITPRNRNEYARRDEDVDLQKETASIRGYREDAEGLGEGLEIAQALPEVNFRYKTDTTPVMTEQDQVRRVISDYDAIVGSCIERSLHNRAPSLMKRIISAIRFYSPFG